MAYKNPEDRRAYQREYQRKWRNRRREEYFADKSCVHCGSKNELELDHVDPSTKKCNISWNWSSARRKAELEKCQVLCRTCHMEKGARQGDLNTSGALISEDLVRAIRSDPLGPRAAARKYGMPYSTVSQIKTRKRRASTPD